MFNVFCSLGFNTEIDLRHNVEIQTRSRRINQVRNVFFYCYEVAVLFICQNYIHLNYILVI